LFGGSRQIYYRRVKSEASSNLKAQEAISLVQGIRYQLPRVGTRKLYHMLQEPLQALHIGRDSLFAIMKANHLDIKPKRQYRITTNSHHRFRKHKNLIENLEVNKPEQVWVSDITYVGSRKRPLYLSLVTDAYSKRIMGYDLSESLAVGSSLKALKMALKARRYISQQLIHHSDRGLQYCSNEYQDLLKRKKVIPSMTESYDPYANAVAERVNGILKDEFMIEKYALDKELMALYVRDSISKYNRIRPHYSCYMLTPEEMHKQNHIKIRTYKKKSTSLKVNLQTCG
jgi:transposase InsO family protein